VARRWEQRNWVVAAWEKALRFKGGESQAFKLRPTESADSPPAVMRITVAFVELGGDTVAEGDNLTEFLAGPSPGTKCHKIQGSAAERVMVSPEGCR